MPFLQLTLHIGARDPAVYEDALFALGATSVTLTDAADDPILEPAPGATPLWPTIIVKGLFAHEADRKAIAAALEKSLPTPAPEIHFEDIADRAWEREWLKDFRPMQFGKRLWICPGGMLPPSELLPVASGQWPVALIQLDPGLAFGTGTHPTTALCLEWLDSARIQDQYIIDYGCGSGILAIAALKLGAREALGTDIDPQALLASRDNAERNQVSARLQLRSCDFAEGASALPAPTSVLLANILAGPLGELAPLFAKLVLPGGQIVLSGILKDQAPALAQTYATWFDMEPPAYRDDWARLTGTRKAAP